MAGYIPRARRSQLVFTTAATYDNRLPPRRDAATSEAAAMITVDVQPPTQAQAGAVLYPPLVISSESDAEYDFVQVVLLDPYGHVLEDQLHGTLSTSKKALASGSAAGSSSSLEYAAFPDLAISYSGSFTLRVNAIRMDYSAPDGPVAVIMTSVTTREIYVYDQTVAVEVPSEEEKTVLHMLRRNRGFGVPRAPR